MAYSIQIITTFDQKCPTLAEMPTYNLCCCQILEPGVYLSKSAGFYLLLLSVMSHN